jgi:hypothetical protein
VGFPQDKKHNLSFLARKSICQPKSQGGLGMCSMEFRNHSLLARLGWKLTSNQPLLWVEVLREKYLKNGVSFLNAPHNPSSSWHWRGLLKSRFVVQKGAYIAISSDLNVEVWQSPWIPTNPNFKPIPNPNLVSLPSFNVADLILEEDCC